MKRKQLSPQRTEHKTLTGLRSPFGTIPFTGRTNPSPRKNTNDRVSIPVKNQAHKVVSKVSFLPDRQPLSTPPAKSLAGWRASMEEASSTDPSYREGDGSRLSEASKTLRDVIRDPAKYANIPQVRREDYYAPIEQKETEEELGRRGVTTQPLWQYCDAREDHPNMNTLGVQEKVVLSWPFEVMTNQLGRTPMMATTNGLKPWKEGEKYLEELYKLGRERKTPITMSIPSRKLYGTGLMYDGNSAMIEGKWEWRKPRKKGRTFFDILSCAKGVNANIAMKAKAEWMTATEGFTTKLADFGAAITYDVFVDDGVKHKKYYPTSLLQVAVIVNMMFTSHYILLSGAKSSWNPEEMPNFGDEIVFDFTKAEEKAFDPHFMSKVPLAANCVRKTITAKDVNAAYEGTKLIWLDQEEGIEGHETYDSFSCFNDLASQLAVPLPITLPTDVESDDFLEHPNFLGFWLHQAYLLSGICASSSLYGVGRRTAIRKMSSTDVLVTMVDHRASGQQKQGEPYRWCLLRKTGTDNVYRVVQQAKSTRAMLEGQLEVARNMCFYSYCSNPLSSQTLFAHGLSLTNSGTLKTAAELANNTTDSSSQMSTFSSFKEIIVQKTKTKGPVCLLESLLMSVLIHAQTKGCPCSLYWNKVIPPQTRASLSAYFRACEKSLKNHCQNQAWARKKGVRKDGNQIHMDALFDFIAEFVEQFVNVPLSKLNLSKSSKIDLGDLMTLKKGLGFDKDTYKAHPVICAVNILQCLSEWETNHQTAIATLQDMIPFLMEHYPEYMQSSYTFPKVQDVSERPIEEVDFFFRMLLTAILILIRGLASGQSLDLASNPGMKEKAMGEAAAFFERAKSVFLTHADVTAFCGTMATDFCTEIVTRIAAHMFGANANITKTINTLLGQVKTRTRTVSREQVLPAMGLWVCQNQSFANPKKGAHYLSNWLNTPYAVTMCGMRFVDLDLVYPENCKPPETTMPESFKLGRAEGEIQGLANPWVLHVTYNKDYIAFHEEFWRLFGHPYTFRVVERSEYVSDVKPKDSDMAEKFCKQQVQMLLTTGTGEGQDMYAESLATAVIISYCLVKKMGFDIKSFRLLVTSDDIYFALAKESNPSESSLTANIDGSDMLRLFNEVIEEMGVQISKMKTGITVKTVDNNAFTALIFNSQLWATSIDGVAHGALLKCIARSFRELMYTPTGHCAGFATALRLIQKFFLEHKFLTEEDLKLINRAQFLSCAINNGCLLYWDTVLSSKHLETAVGCPLIRNLFEIRQDPYVLLIEHIGEQGFNYLSFKRGIPSFVDTVYKTHREAEQYSNLAKMAISQSRPTALHVVSLMLAMKQMNKEDSDDISFPQRVAYHWGNCYLSLYSQVDMEGMTFRVDTTTLPHPFLELYTKELEADSSSKYFYFYYTGSSKPANRPDETAVLSWLDLSVTEGRVNKGLPGDIISGNTLADMAYELTNYEEPDYHVVCARPRADSESKLVPCLSFVSDDPEYGLENCQGPKLLALIPSPLITYSPTGLTILRTHTGKLVLGRDSVAVCCLKFTYVGEEFHLVPDKLTPAEKLFVSPYFSSFDIGVHDKILDKTMCNKNGFFYVLGFYQGESLLSTLYSCAQPMTLLKNYQTFLKTDIVTKQDLLKVTDTCSDWAQLLLQISLPREKESKTSPLVNLDPVVQSRMRNTAVGFICRPGLTVTGIDDAKKLLELLQKETTVFNTLTIQEDQGNNQMLLCFTTAEDTTYRVICVKNEPVIPHLGPEELATSSPVVSDEWGWDEDCVKVRESKQVEQDVSSLKLPEGFDPYEPKGDVSYVRVLLEPAQRPTYTKARARDRTRNTKKGKDVKINFGQAAVCIETSESSEGEKGPTLHERKGSENEPKVTFPERKQKESKNNSPVESERRILAGYHMGNPVVVPSSELVGREHRGFHITTLEGISVDLYTQTLYHIAKNHQRYVKYAPAYNASNATIILTDPDFFKLMSSMSERLCKAVTVHSEMCPDESGKWVETELQEKVLIDQDGNTSDDIEGNCLSLESMLTQNRTKGRLVRVISPAPESSTDHYSWPLRYLTVSKTVPLGRGAIPIFTNNGHTCFAIAMAQMMSCCRNIRLPKQRMMINQDIADENGVTTYEMGRYLQTGTVWSPCAYEVDQDCYLMNINLLGDFTGKGLIVRSGWGAELGHFFLLTCREAGLWTRWDGKGPEPYLLESEAFNVRVAAIGDLEVDD